jgi:hypothetical protein
MNKALLSAFVLASFFAGCGGGAKDAGPVPSASVPNPTISTGQTTAATKPDSASSTSTAASPPPPPLCSDRTAAVTVASHEGAAGTISTLWRVKNTAQAPCRSFGYPGMDFRAPSGWLDVRVHRGGFPNIDRPPAPVVLRPGKSLYFVSYWNDVTTSAGPCKEFDRVKVTLPDNFAPAKLAASGCLDPSSVDVGPVSTSPPA